MFSDKRILLVDDDPMDRELIIDSLKEAGIGNPVDTACDGVEAIEYLFESKKSNKLVLILLDIKMPRMGGIETLQKIKETKETEHIPVVILTSSKEDIDVYNSYKFKASGFVCKPVNFEDFQDVVKKIGLFWCLVNQTANK